MSIQNTFKDLQNSFLNTTPKSTDLAGSMGYYAVAGKVADVLLLSNPIGLYGGAVYGASSYIVNVPLESFVNKTWDESVKLGEKEKLTEEEQIKLITLVGTYALTKIAASSATLALASFAGVQLSFLGSMVLPIMPFVALPLIVLPIVAAAAFVALPIILANLKQPETLPDQPHLLNQTPNTQEDTLNQATYLYNESHLHIDQAQIPQEIKDELHTLQNDLQAVRQNNGDIHDIAIPKKSIVLMTTVISNKLQDTLRESTLPTAVKTHFSDAINSVVEGINILANSVDYLTADPRVEELPLELEN